jgi:hypothetical protein
LNTLNDAQAQNQHFQGEQTTLAGLELDNQSALGTLQFKSGRPATRSLFTSSTTRNDRSKHSGVSIPILMGNFYDLPSFLLFDAAATRPYLN